ncbi:RagB/SusD family nutrient uptake outer membrane protein [Sphingobacterium bovistauri]|uniref:RagB/SusD family nutrient uptake outer membrane protein n=1 Tax=Sphingobacterium bovistauri TaxID=2781959 RepID=A0ABS7Z9C5_9SPHI|nr:RagB/SusD family nutrient uptake outer membrane protein [Sphingobacterium bovistauri]MCA5006755.1 RagB/SusD family nutrient uptake outer membrane protein [Sphingobacterium bovistauri]
MKRYTYLHTLIVILLLCSSCEKFLNVNPKSSISEDDLLSSEVGFQQALTGVYSQFASRELYGDNLTMGFASALGQNYTTSANFKFKETTALNYQTSEVMNYGEQIWQKSYKAIAGLNNILANIDQQKQFFIGNNYVLIKGESLGLRAYLHFDLLRIFAPNNTNDPNKLAIPYRTELNSTAQRYITVSESIELILKDLKDAESLLKDIDPILKNEKNRKYSMNFLAIKALEARVLLYKGDKTGAYNAAQSVINSEVLSFITNARISAAAATKDRLFSTEQVFSIRIRKMIDWVEAGGSPYFKFIASGSPLHLTISQANFNSLYETTSGGSTDYRYLYLTELNGSVRFPSKYWQTWSLIGFTENDRLDQTVPLIRLSELYYIIAESTQNRDEAFAAINQVRRNRGLSQLNQNVANLENEISKEYQKEFYAEGQLFFFYKRINASTMRFRTGTVTANHYILPIPNSETEFNPQQNN